MSILRKRIWQFWLYRWAHTRAIPATRFIARRFGDRFGFVYVGGYPRSGTTWMARLVGHYLDIPFPRDYAMPLAFECVVQHHWRCEPPFAGSIYVVRDGRDVMVSEFVRMMRGIEATRVRRGELGRTSVAERLLLERVGRDARLARRMERLFGRDCDPWDVERNLPIFIEANMRRPLSEVVGDPWPLHVSQWLDGPAAPAVVRYEDLLRDTAGVLSRTLSAAVGTPVDGERVRATVERYGFERMTGRRRGDEDRTSEMRKGISGDWKNYFNREACEVFDHHAGEALIRAGYEDDRDWVGSV